MKSSHPRTFWVIFLLALVAGIQNIQFVDADPMTGGNAPYEDCAPPCAVSCYVPPPRFPWYVQTDAMALRRDPYRNTAFASLGSALPSDIALSTSELDRQFKVGSRLLVGHTFGDTCYSIEGSYFCLDTWEPAAVLRNNDLNARGTLGNLYSPFSNFGNPALTGFDYNTLVSVSEISRLQNGEANVKFLIPTANNGFRASFLTGIRYVNVQEDFFYHSESHVPTLAGGSSVNFTTHTSNDLIGPQIGGYFEFYSIPNSWITFEAKGAICGNTALQESTGYRSNLAGASPVFYDARADHVATAFVGDLELMFNWQVTPHCIARFGYQAMWVDGLALAAQNFGPDSGVFQTNTATLDTGGNVVYHGPHLGIEVTW